MSDIGSWLDELGLGGYAETLAENEVDWEVLPDLSEEDLKDIGLPLGARKKLLKAVRALGDAAQPKGEPTPVAPSTSDAERRQLTVMFCDLVGSTALSDRMDPERYRDVLSAYQSAALSAIALYEGYVARYMGDGLLIYFGYPQAHEDDAARAVYAGLDIVSAVSQLALPDTLALQVRIGISTGLVVVGDIVGEGASEERAVLGDTPNLAARLQGIAKPNQVVIAETTHRLAEGHFQISSLGQPSLKGITDPGIAYAVGGTKDASRFVAATGGGLRPLVGRAEELGILARRWELALGGEGQVVLLRGEPGIGKSRLVEALREETGSEANSLDYQCSPYYVNAVFHPIIEQLKRVADFEADDDAEARSGKLEKLVETTVDDPSSAVPLLAGLLSLPAPSYPRLDMPPAKQNTDTIAVLTRLMTGEGQLGPQLVVVEDAHWMDASTQELFEAVIDSAETLPVLVIITHRPGFDPPWMERGHVTRLSLSRLGKQDSARLITGIAGENPLPDEVLEQILAKTDGTPLFLEELTKSFLESGALSQSEPSFELSGALPTTEIPSTLQDSLMARIDRLGPAKELAQMGAVLGREFTYLLLSGLSGLEEGALQTTLEQLVSAEVLARRGAIPHSTYFFRHALLRDAAYNSLLFRIRQVLHAKVVELLRNAQPASGPPDHALLAYHLERAERWSEAFDEFVLAAQGAVQTHALYEAFLLYQQATSTPERQAASIAPRHLTKALKATADVLFARGQFKESHTVGSRMRELAREQRDDLSEGTALLSMAMAKMWEEDFDSALAHAAEAKLVGEREGVVGPDAGGAMISGYLHGLSGRLEEAGVELDRSIEISRSRNDHTYLPPAYFMSANIQNWTGQYDAAIELAVQGVESAQLMQQNAHYLRCSWVQGAALSAKGAYDEGLRILNDGLALAEKMGDAGYVPRFVNTLGWLYIEVHEYELGAEYSRRGYEMARGTRQAVGVERTMYALLNWADALLALGDHDGARELLSEARGVVENPRTHEWMRWRYSTHFFASMREFWIATGDPKKAKSWVERCLEIARAKNSRKYLAIAQRINGLTAMAQNDATTAARAFHAAEAVAAQIGHPNEIWKCRSALASLEDRAGNQERSDDYKKGAREVLAQAQASIRNVELAAQYGTGGSALAVIKGELVW